MEIKIFTPRWLEMVFIFLKVARIGDREKFFPILPILKPEIGMPNTEY